MRVGRMPDGWPRSDIRHSGAATSARGTQGHRAHERHPMRGHARGICAPAPMGKWSPPLEGADVARGMEGHKNQSNNCQSEIRHSDQGGTWNVLLQTAITHRPGPETNRMKYEAVAAAWSARGLCRDTADELQVWAHSRNTSTSAVGIFFLTETWQNTQDSLLHIAIWVRHRHC
jgi:hypothetical protein